MAAHEFADGAERCMHCSTLKTSVNHTICPGPQRHDAPTLRPEPARHEYASEAFDEIGTRVRELHAERTAAMNEPAKES